MGAKKKKEVKNPLIEHLGQEDAFEEDSPGNQQIQAKFDQVFGDSESDEGLEKNSLELPMGEAKPKDKEDQTSSFNQDGSELDVNVTLSEATNLFENVFVDKGPPTKDADTSAEDSSDEEESESGVPDGTAQFFSAADKLTGEIASESEAGNEDSSMTLADVGDLQLEGSSGDTQDDNTSATETELDTPLPQGAEGELTSSELNPSFDDEEATVVAKNLVDSGVLPGSPEIDSEASETGISANRLEPLDGKMKLEMGAGPKKSKGVFRSGKTNVAKGQAASLEDKAHPLEDIGNHNDNSQVTNTVAGVHDNPFEAEDSSFATDIDDDDSFSTDDEATVVRSLADVSLGINSEGSDFNEEATRVIGQESFDDEATLVRPLAGLKPSNKVQVTQINLQNQVHATGHGHHEELGKFGATIGSLREDREKLLRRIQELETDRIHLEDNNLNLRAELDDKKIELSLLKKRFNDEVEGMSYAIKIADDKKSFYEAKIRDYEREIQRLGQRVKIDINQIRSHEQELENQLDLLKSDAQTQIKNRDAKILELKRKIDALEFNMENLTIQSHKSKEDEQSSQEQLRKVLNGLKSTIALMEEEELQRDPREILKKIKL